MSEHPVPSPPPVQVHAPEPAWGRVDGDGTVYVRVAGDEVAVGSFQAGTHEEALAYFTRKFEALAVEVDLLERRVALPEVAPEESLSTVKRVRETLATPTCVGDIVGLRARLEALVPVIEGRKAEARAAKDEARLAAKAARERIVSDAEALADSTQWKVAGERLRTLLEEWKTAPHVDRSTEQALWKRFGAARNSFDRRRRQHFAHLSAEQGVVKTAKLAIIAEISPGLPSPIGRASSMTTGTTSAAVPVMKHSSASNISKRVKGSSLTAYPALAAISIS